MSQISILTGPVKSGKTTRLANWIKQQDDCAGILAPVQGGLRYLYAIHSQQSKLLEIKNRVIAENRIIRIGNFCFYREVFDWAQAELLIAFKRKPNWLIIDEIGPLEIDGTGLEPAVSKIIYELSRYDQPRLILVIREQLLATFFKSYRINDNEVGYIQI